MLKAGLRLEFDQHDLAGIGLPSHALLETTSAASIVSWKTPVCQVQPVFARCFGTLIWWDTRCFTSGGMATCQD